MSRVAKRINTTTLTAEAFEAMQEFYESISKDKKALKRLNSNIKKLEGQVNTRKNMRKAWYNEDPDHRTADDAVRQFPTDDLTDQIHALEFERDTLRKSRNKKERTAARYIPESMHSAYEAYMDTGVNKVMNESCKTFLKYIGINTESEKAVDDFVSRLVRTIGQDSNNNEEDIENGTLTKNKGGDAYKKLMMRQLITALVSYNGLEIVEGELRKVVYEQAETPAPEQVKAEEQVQA